MYINPKCYFLNCGGNDNEWCEEPFRVLSDDRNLLSVWFCQNINHKSKTRPAAYQKAPPTLRTCLPHSQGEKCGRLDSRPFPRSTSGENDSTPCSLESHPTDWPLHAMHLHSQVPWQALLTKFRYASLSFACFYLLYNIFSHKLSQWVLPINWWG